MKRQTLHLRTICAVSHRLSNEASLRRGPLPCGQRPGKDPIPQHTHPSLLHVGSGNFFNDHGAALMKLVAEYLEQARCFGLIAASEKNPDLRIALERQADMYRRRAEVRAERFGKPLPDRAETEAQAAV
jgi:hypothetical protein